MAKRTSGGGLAALIGRELGKLAARKDALAKQLAAVEREIAAVRDQITKAVGGGSVGNGRKRAVKTARRVMSPEARAKMAAAAKRRWAAAKKAGKNALG